MRVPFLLAALLIAGCVTPGAQVQPPTEGDAARVPAAGWKAALSEPRFSGIVSSLAEAVSKDGTKLSLTLHLPQGLPADAQVPTLLQLTPYQPLDARKSTPEGTDGPSSEWGDYVLRGAAYVEADARGTGGSEGCLDFGGAKDREDADAFVEWVRAQPWSNGVVVTDGVSHPGMGSVVAHAGAQHLTAALAHAPVVSYYRDEWYQGAKFEDQLNGPAYQAIELLPPAYLDPDALRAQAAPCVGKTVLDFEQPDGRFGATWADRDLAAHLPDREVPILLTNGFIDRNVHPDHVQSYWDALPESYPKHVIWGWWYHGWPDMKGHPAETFKDLRHRWLDATLFGLDNGLWAEPRVLVEDSTGAWHEGDRWPLESSENVTLWPTAEKGLADAPGADGKVAYEDKLGAVRGRWTDASAVFRTEPLAQAKLVVGAPTVSLVASSNVDSTKWVVYLLDESPDGTWQRVTHGYADSHAWSGPDQWAPMEPGKAYNWTIRLMPTAVVVDAGHRLVLVVASQDSHNTNQPDPVCFDDHRGSCYDPSGIRPAETAGRAVNQVHVGPGGTSVSLAWMDPAAQLVS